MNNFRMEKLAQLRGIVKTAFGEGGVAAAIKQIEEAKTLQELEALKAKAEADPRTGYLSQAQIASMQTAYDMKKAEFTAATAAPTQAPQTTGGAATTPTANAGAAPATAGAQKAGQKYIDAYPELKVATEQELMYIIKDELNSAGTTDNGNFYTSGDTKIVSAGYYLGLFGKEDPNYIIESLKTIGVITSGYKDISDLIDTEGAGLGAEFVVAFTAGNMDHNASSASATPVPSAGGSSAGNSGGSGRNSGGGSKGSDDKTAVIKRELWGTTLSDSAYKYMISNDGKSFQWANANKSGEHSQGDSKWGKMVDNLNLIPPTGQKRDTAKPTPATPETTAAPVTPAATGLDQSLIQKVAAVLQKASLYTLNVKSIQNEQVQIRTLGGQLKGFIGLAAIIVSRVGGSLTTLSGATLADINSSTQKELAVNKGGRFSGDVGIILRQVNELSKIGNRSPESLAQMAKSLTMAPATPAAPVAPAKASASLDKKFIKAATLRRMRIRSQMEAAVDSSAQMGRYRVF